MQKYTCQDDVTSRRRRSITHIGVLKVRVTRITHRKVAVLARAVYNCTHWDAIRIYDEAFLFGPYYNAIQAPPATYARYKVITRRTCMRPKLRCDVILSFFFYFFVSIFHVTSLSLPLFFLPSFLYVYMFRDYILLKCNIYYEGTQRSVQR